MPQKKNEKFESDFVFFNILLLASQHLLEGIAAHHN